MTESERIVARRRSIRILVETTAVLSALMQADRFMIEKINCKPLDLDQLNGIFMQLLADHSDLLQHLVPEEDDNEKRIIPTTN